MHDPLTAEPSFGYLKKVSDKKFEILIADYDNEVMKTQRQEVRVFMTFLV